MIGKKNVMLTIFHTIYLFEMMLTMILLDQRSTAADTSAWVIALRYVSLAAGFVLFSAMRSLVARPKDRLVLLIGMNIGYLAGILGAFFLTDGSGVAVFFNVAVALMLGLLGGFTNYCMAMGLTESRFSGRIFGISGAVAFLLQVLCERMVFARFILVAVLLMGFGLTAWFVRRYSEIWLLEDAPEYASADDEEHRLSAAVIVLGMFVCVMFGVPSFLGDAMQWNLMRHENVMFSYTWPRLGGCIGYLLLGMAADIGKRRYLPLVCLSGEFLLCLTFFGFGAENPSSMALFLYSTLMLCWNGWHTLFFWDFAPKTRRPDLWANVGRSISTVILGIAALWVPEISAGAAVGICVAVLVVVMILLAFYGMLPEKSASSVTGKETSWVEEKAAGEEKGLESNAQTEAAKSRDPGMRIRLFAERYALTPREVEIVQLVLMDDSSIKELAPKLAMSERVLYRHLSSIYEKTGTDGRLALLRLYFEE